MVTATDFLRDNNTVKWEALATSLVGGVFFAWWTGLIEVVQAVEGAFQTVFGGIGTIVQYEVDQYLLIVESLFNPVRTLDTDYGVFELPIGMVLALLAMSIVALGVWYLVQ